MSLTRVTLLDRLRDLRNRTESLSQLEPTSEFDEGSNQAYGFTTKMLDDLIEESDINDLFNDAKGG